MGIAVTRCVTRGTKYPRKTRESAALDPSIRALLILTLAPYFVSRTLCALPLPLTCHVVASQSPRERPPAAHVGPALSQGGGAVLAGEEKENEAHVFLRARIRRRPPPIASLSSSRLPISSRDDWSRLQ